jgi:hypothetical protein
LTVAPRVPAHPPPILRQGWTEPTLLHNECVRIHFMSKTARGELYRVDSWLMVCHESKAQSLRRFQGPRTGMLSRQVALTVHAFRGEHVACTAPHRTAALANRYRLAAGGSCFFCFVWPCVVHGMPLGYDECDEQRVCACTASYQLKLSAPLVSSPPNRIALTLWGSMETRNKFTLFTQRCSQVPSVVNFGKAAGIMHGIIAAVNCRR